MMVYRAMTTVFADLSVSLDGFVAGPDQSMQDPLGIGGMKLHDWAFAAQAWLQAHGHEGGEEQRRPRPDSPLSPVLLTTLICSAAATPC